MAHIFHIYLNECTVLLFQKFDEIIMIGLLLLSGPCLICLRVFVYKSLHFYVYFSCVKTDVICV